MIKYVIEIFALYCVLLVITIGVGVLIESEIGIALMVLAICWRIILSVDRRLSSKGKEK